jgi:hypothetical protein
MKNQSPAPMGATFPAGKNFAGYRAKASEMSLFDVAVKLNRLFAEFLPEDTEETEEMKATICQTFVSRSNKRVSYSAYNDDILISLTFLEKEEVES